MTEGQLGTVLRHLRDLSYTLNAGDLTDTDLVQRFVHHQDEVAFKVLVRRHGGLVLRVCRNVLRQEADAEDAFQATFLVLARQAVSIQKQTSISCWLHGVAFRTAMNLRKSTMRRHKHERAAVDRRSPESPVSAAALKELQFLLDEELQCLPMCYRAPFVLCCLEGKSRTEAAQELGLKEGTLASRLAKARKMMQHRLTARGVSLSAALCAVAIVPNASAAAPPLLTTGTIKAALVFAAGKAAGAVSAPVIALAKGVLQGMLITKVKTGAALALLVLLGVFAAGALVAYQETAEKQTKRIAEPNKAAEKQAEPKKDKLALTDRYGDPLPPGAIARLGTVRFRVPTEPQTMAFAPDGKTIAVSAYGGLFLFAADSGKRIKRLTYHQFSRNYQKTLAFSPDSKRLAAWGRPAMESGKENEQYRQVVRIWELAGAGKPREYDVEHVIWTGWSADNAPLVVCQEKGEVSLRELETGRSRRFECRDLGQPDSGDHLRCPCALEGKTLVVCDKKNTLHVWDTATGAERCTVSLNNLRFVLALSPDGRELAILDEKSVHIWDAVTGRALRTVATDHKYMSTLAFAPDGKTLATAGLTGIRFWDVATGRERNRVEGEGASTAKIAFSGNGQTLATLQLHFVAFHVWDVATGKNKAEPVGHAARPYGTSFSPDGRRLVTSGGLDGTIHMWDLAKSESLISIYRDPWVRNAIFSRDGRSLFSTWTDDNLWISDAATGKRQHVIKLEDPERPDTWQSAMSMHLSADGKTLVAFSYYYPKKDDVHANYDDTLITGWDPDTRKQLFRRRLPGRGQTAVSPDLRLLAVPYHGGAPLSPARWNFALKSAELDPRKMLGYLFADLSEGEGGPMRIEDLTTGKLLLTLPQLKGQTWPVAFSPDGRLLAASNFNYQAGKKGDPPSPGETLRLWELATAAEVLSLPLAGQHRAAFSADGRLLALTAPKQDIVVWDLLQGRELRRFKDFDADVTWLAFAPDGRQLVSGLADSTLLIWDVGAPSAPKEKLTAEDLAKAWDDLSGSDAPRAFRAQGALVSMPDVTLALFQKHLKPVQPADPGRLQKLVDDLNSQQLPIRTAANKDLEELGDLAAGALRQALAKNSSPELRRRVQTLLDKLQGPLARPEVLRGVRAAAVLERIASPDARKLMEALAQGAPEARLTKESQAALQRLGTISMRAIRHQSEEE